MTKPTKSTPSAERKVKKTFTVSPSTIKQAQRKSEQTGISMSHVVETALRRWIDGVFNPTN